jgi:hypothetical protein
LGTCTFRKEIDGGSCFHGYSGSRSKTQLSGGVPNENSIGVIACAVAAVLLPKAGNGAIEKFTRLQKESIHPLNTSIHRKN